MNLIQKHWPIISVIVILVIGASIIFVQAANANTPPLVLPNAKILYLAPATLSTTEDTPGSFATLQAEGITILHDYSDLKRSTEQAKPDAIILHQLSLPSVDKDWVVKQYHNGIIVAAINVKMRDMANLVSDPSILDSPWTDNWYKMPFYSYVGIKITLSPSGEPTGERVVHGTNNINDREGNLTHFLYTLKLAIKAFGAQP
jgi:hypothetical protein